MNQAMNFILFLYCPVLKTPNYYFKNIPNRLILWIIFNYSIYGVFFEYRDIGRYVSL